MRAGVLFSGFGGVELAMKRLGIAHIWGLEKEDKIAQVARQNGLKTYTQDILTQDPAGISAVDWLHASPPCPRFSLANAQRGETDEDTFLAYRVGRYIGTHRPRLFTLENVPQYVKSCSWRIIQAALCDYGYLFTADTVNFADYGVPQSRRRLIVRAVHGGFVPPLPAPLPAVGWYDALADIIPTLPDAKFTEWQLKRLPEQVSGERLLVGASGRDGDSVQAAEDAPAFTITGNTNQTSIRAFLMDSKNTRQEWGKGYCEDNAPAMTILSGMNRPSAMPRALLVGGANTSDEQAAPGVGVSEDMAPACTVNATNSQYWRAWLEGGRVVRLTPRALARLQTFPDEYQLPEAANLACLGIGNACPPVGFANVMANLLEAVNR